MDNRPPGPVIQYASPLDSTDQLQLIEEAGVVRVIFPAPPAWHFALNIAGMFMCFAPPVVSIAAIFYMAHQLKMNRFAVGFSVGNAMGWWNIVFNAVGGILGLLLIVHEIRKFRRWGRVSRVLILEPGRITTTRLGFRRMRSRTLLTASIKSVDLRIVTDLFTRRPHSTLIIWPHKGFPLRFPLPTRDTELPGRILAAVRSALSQV